MSLGGSSFSGSSTTFVSEESGGVASCTVMSGIVDKGDCAEGVALRRELVFVADGCGDFATDNCGDGAISGKVVRVRERDRDSLHTAYWETIWYKNNTNKMLALFANNA
ncbi:hypothetical protein SFRURICE_008337 [Spodoptera frugiperda]|nr:hypothetical protein SFRURICE_008337 [Spodoptera frugiperda]